MKLFLLALVAAVLLSATCDARKRRIGTKRLDKNERIIAKVKEPKAQTYSDEDSTEEIDDSDEVDALTDFDDFDEDTEAVVNVLNLASKILGDDEVKNKGKETRQKLRKTGKTDAKDLKGYVKSSKQCDDMEEKVEEICSKVSYAMKERFLERIYLNKLRKSEKKAGWVECCGLDTAEERFDCFTDIKVSKLNDMCDASKKSKRITKCCQVKDQARLNCFNRINKKDCRPSPVKPTRKPTAVTKAPMCKYEGKKSPDVKQRKNRQMRGRKRTSLGDSRKQQKVNKMCCKAGQYSREDNSTLGTYETCKQSYESWANTVKGTTDACPDKFIWCCMNLKTGSAKKPKNNATTKPKPTQELPEKLPTLDYCCSAGRNRSNNAGGLGAKLECYRGQAELQRERPEYGTECFSDFFKCCMQPKTTLPPPPPVIKDEEFPTKNPTGWDPRYKDGKLPDGLRRSPSGHYYYVDFAAPDVPDIKQQFVKPPAL